MSSPAKLSLRTLARAWQMLLKGIEEAKRTAPRPLAAADMVLVRIAHAADLPTPDEAVRALGDGGRAGDARSPTPRPAGPDNGRVRLAASGGASAQRRGRMPRASERPRAEPAPKVERFEDVVALAPCRSAS